MPIEVAGISLHRVHAVRTREEADFVRHRIPGLDGDIVQDMGRKSVRLRISGMFFGEEALEDLASLRELYQKREPVDFLAELVDQAYFAQVILERLEVQQVAGAPESIAYELDVAEYVEPPEPEFGDLGLPEVDLAIELEALDFMDMIQLPDLLSVPDFGDPTPPLANILDSVKDSLSGLDDAAASLSDLFSEA